MILERAGLEPVQINRLVLDDRDQIFTKCVRYNLTTETWKNSGLLLKFNEEKPTRNYFRELRNLWKKAKPGEKKNAVIKFLNDLNLNALPLSHNCTWNAHRNSLKELHAALEKFGRCILYNATNMRHWFPRINDIECRRTLMHGVFDNLYIYRYNKNLNLTPEKIISLSELLKDVIKGVKQNKFPPSGLQLDQLWWDSMLEEHAKKPLDCTRVNDLVTILFPLIKFRYSRKSVV